MNSNKTTDSNKKKTYVRNMGEGIILSTKAFSSKKCVCCGKKLWKSVSNTMKKTPLCRKCNAYHMGKNNGNSKK